MARPPSPPGVPTPTPTPRPCAPLPTGVSPADYFATCLVNARDANKPDDTLTYGELDEWGNEILAAMRAAEE